MFLRLNGRLDIWIMQLVSFDRLLVEKSGYSSLNEQLNEPGCDEASSSIATGDFTAAIPMSYFSSGC